MAWKTVKQSGLSQGDVTLAKTSTGNKVTVTLLSESSVRRGRWNARNHATGREVSITKVWLAT